MRFVPACLVLLTIPCAAYGVEVPANLKELSQAYAESSSARDREPLSKWVLAQRGQDRAWGHFAIGLGDHFAGQHEKAAANLLLAVDDTEPVADYALYYLGRSLAQAEDHSGAADALALFSRRFSQSRFAPSADQIRAESLIRERRYRDAFVLLEHPRASQMPEPARVYLLGRIRELQGNHLQAVETYRQVYYYHPASEYASKAEERLDGLRRLLGGRYPEAPNEWRLRRADLLFEANKHGSAADEYRRALAGLRGADAEHAKLRFGAASYLALRTSAAYDWLRSMEFSDPELEAQRLYYLGECARRKGLVAEFERRADELERKFPKSPWLEEAFFSLGNFYLLRNDGQKSRKYYERAARSFPRGQHAARAHWKVAWRAHLNRDPQAAALFEEHVRLYPGSDQASASLYWLGRLREKAGKTPEARALYQLVEEHYPHYYYAHQARSRSSAISGSAAVLPAHLAPLAAALPGPRRISTDARSETLGLIERGRLLADLGFFELAEREMSSANYAAPDAFLVGLELSRVAEQKDRYFRGLRYMKRYGFGYLRMPIESMPREFWERLYPMPWEDALRQRAASHGLDPYLVAGLIRQESEYDHNAVSRAGAIGLMQIMPRTGQELFRRLGMGGFSAARLRDPDISLRLGTFHLKEVLDRFEGRLELALAAYNAGASRAKEWITWEEFSEPGEFVETIPFTETRGYVQSVLRNREVYRILYDGESLVAGGQVSGK